MYRSSRINVYVFKVPKKASMIPRKGSGPQSKDQQLNLPSAMKAYDVHLGYSLPSSSPGYYLRIK